MSIEFVEHKLVFHYGENYTKEEAEKYLCESFINSPRIPVKISYDDAKKLKKQIDGILVAHEILNTAEDIINQKIAGNQNESYIKI